MCYRLVPRLLSRDSAIRQHKVIVASRASSTGHQPSSPLGAPSPGTARCESSLMARPVPTNTPVTTGDGVSHAGCQGRRARATARRPVSPETEHGHEA